MFELKLYEEKDRDVYLQLQKNSFEKYIIEFFGKFTQSVMERHLEVLKANLFKIMLGENVAGFVYNKEEEDKIIIDVFCLFPEFRNNGLGSKVMQSFIEKSKQVNKPIFVDTFKTNPAKKFYERHGFVVVDENYSHFILQRKPQV